MKKILDISDYIFFRSYQFFCSHRIFRGMEVIDAISVIFYIIFIPIAAIMGTMANYYGIKIDRYGMHRYIGMLLFFLVGYLPLMKRYMYNKSITKRNYQIFKDRWGKEDPKQRKKRGWIIAAIVINNIIIIPIVLAIFQHYFL